MPANTNIMPATKAARRVSSFDAFLGRDALTPTYLRHYWFAYTWPPAISMWDIRIGNYHPLINGVVFFQYNKLVRTLACMLSPDGTPLKGRTLQISSAYGHAVPTVAKLTEDYTLIDIVPRQLAIARHKNERYGIYDTKYHRMNAEHLAFANHAFERSIIFMLLHELPADVRSRVLAEAIRVVKPGGMFYLAEYNELADEEHLLHPLHRQRWFHFTSRILEPYLPEFLKENLEEKLAAAAATVGKKVVRTKKTHIFGGFYRVHEYAVSAQ